MAHYAKIVYGKVTAVRVAEAEFFDNFVDDSPGTWVQTSYNTRGGKHYAPNSNTEDSGTPIRKNFAAIGMNYDGTGFYNDAPYPSWTLDANGVWQPPHKNGLIGVVAPEQSTDDSFHEGVDNKWSLWDEDAYNLDNTKGWGKHEHDHEGHHPE